MNQQIQPGAHLDADQISVFVEGVATAREREQVLAHLARCPECRGAVFLLQTPEKAATVPAPAPERRPRLRWFKPIGLAGAALAAGITMLVLLRPHQPAPIDLRQQASVQQPAPTAPLPATAPKPLPPTAQNPKAALARPNLPAPLPATGANVGELDTVQNRALAGLPPPDGPGTARSSAARPDAAPAAPIRAVAVPPPATVPVPPQLAAAKPQPPVGAVADQNLPLTGRSLTTLERPSFLPALRIEHDRGPDNGFSRVNGRVMDASGAVISGATVTLRDAAGATRRATTANDGAFDLSAVTPGHYELFISAPGFETSKQAVDLEPRDLAMLDSALRVGTSTETVAVEAAAPPGLNTSTAEVSAVLRNLPSHLPLTNTVTSGKRTLSLDSAGTLFLSRNGGRNWKKIKPAWSGKVVDIGLEGSAAQEPDVPAKKSKRSAPTAPPAVFQITTNSGAHWFSRDGSHWLAR